MAKCERAPLSERGGAEVELDGVRAEETQRVAEGARAARADTVRLRFEELRPDRTKMYRENPMFHKFPSSAQ